MKLNELYSKLSDLFSNCSPLYSNLILLIFITIGLVLRIKYESFSEYSNILFISIGTFIIHFSVVFFLCKKILKKKSHIL